MAERVLSWQVLVDFKKARTESKKTQREIENLDESQERLNKNSARSSKEAVAGATKQAAAEKTRQNSIKGTISALQQKRAADRAAAQESKAGSKAEATAAQAAATAVEAARRKMIAADGERIRSLAAVKAAERDYAKVVKETSAASLLAVAAEARLSNARAQHVDNTRQARGATTAYNGAMKQANVVQEQVAGGAGRVTRAVTGSGLSFRRFGRILKGIGIGAIVALLGDLVSVLSQVTAGAIALSGPLLSTVNILAAVPQAASVAAGALATLVAAFSGVGEALKQHGAAQGAAAKNTKAAGDSAKQQARAVRNAKEAVVDAMREEREAQKALSAARQQARRDLADLSRELERNAQNQESASQSVEEARQRLNEVLLDPNATDLERRQADLAVRDAQSNLEQIKVENKRAEKDATQTRKKGVKGADEVVAAAQRQKDAIRGVRDANEALADAQKGTAAATIASAAAVDKYAEAMAKLSPEGRAFVATLISLKPKLDAIRNAAQKGLLPGLGEALVEVSKLTPIAERGMFMFGQSMANTAKNAAKYLTQRSSQEKMGRVLDSNGRIMDILGRAAVNVLAALLTLADSARPFTEWLARVVEGWTEGWRAQAEFNNETGRTEAKLEKVKGRLQVLGDIISNVWGTLKNLGKAGEETGDSMLESIEKVTAGWEEYTASEPGQDSLKDWFEGSKETLGELARMVGIITKGFFEMGKSDATSGILKQINDELLPAIGRVFKAFDDAGVGTAIVDLLTSVADAISEVVEAGAAPFATFVSVLDTFVDVIKEVVKLPGAGKILSAIAVGLGAIMAVNFIGKFTGLNTLATFLLKQSGSTEVASRGIGTRMALALGSGFKKAFVGVKGAIRRDVASAGQGAVGSSAVVGGGSARGRRSTRKAARAQEAQKANNVAAYNYGGTGSQPAGVKATPSTKKADKRKAREEKRAQRKDKPGIAKRMNDRAQKKGEGGFIGVGGPKKSPAAPAAGKTGPPDANTGKLAGGATKAAGAVGALSLAMAFLPGPVGQAATALLIGVSVFQALAGVFPLILKGLTLLKTALLTNPFFLIAAAIAVVVFLVIKYWDQIKGAVLAGIRWIGNFIKRNWGIIKWFLGPIAVLITLIVKNWDRIKELFMRGVRAIGNFVKNNWGVIKWFMGPLGLLIDQITKNWDKIKSIFKKGVAAVGKIVEAIGSVFDSPGKAFRTAINWIIDGTNKVLGFLGLGKIDRLSEPKKSSGGSTPKKTSGLTMARGGDVPGQGNRDTVPATLMPGEFVLRKAAVKRIGRGNLHAMNEGKTFRGRKRAKFNTGGPVGPAPAPQPSEGGLGNPFSGAVNAAKGALSKAGDVVKTVGGKVVDLGRLGAYKGAQAIMGPIRSRIGDMFPGGSIAAKFGRRMGGKAIDGVLKFIKGKDDGGSGGGNSILSKGMKAPLGSIRPAGTWGRYASGGSHPALDFPVGVGHKVTAVGKGKVSSVQHLAGSYGNHIRVKHGAGFESIYAHLSQTLAGTGKNVGTKSVIGKSGNSGNSTGPHLHLEVRKSGAPVNFTKWLRYARGGSVPKKKKDWEVPALLTPGEFVMNRESAKNIGMRELERMNRGAGDGTNRFHKGGEATSAMSPWGPVLGMKKGMKGHTPRALRYLLGMDTSSNEWTGGVDSALKTKGSAALTGPVTSNASRNSFLNWMRGGTRSARSGLKRYDGNESRLYGNYVAASKTKTFKKMSKKRKAPLSKWASSFNKQKNADMLALNTRLGLKINKSGWGTQGRSAMAHILNHTYRRPHDDLSYRPWQAWTAAEASTINQEAANKKQEQYNGYLETLSNWGLGDLVKDLLSKGVEDGFATAQTATANKDVAIRLNNALRNATALTGEDQASLLGMVSLFSAGAGNGLRETARAIERSDLETVTLYEKAKALGRLSKVPASNLSKIESDIAKFRQGTFYAATGGEVPGSGNGDTVPAMLTPGEFVLRKKAVKALGLDRLRQMNGDKVKGYNAGGLVEAFGGFGGMMPFAKGGQVPNVSPLPSAASGTGAGKTVNVTYETTINNPVRETSTKSLTKSLQRRAVVNGANEFNPKEGDQ